VAVVLGMVLGRFCRMVSCVVEVTLRRMRVVSRRLMVATVVMLCRFVVMPGGVFVVLCCLAVMFCCFLRHRIFS